MLSEMNVTARSAVSKTLQSAVETSALETKIEIHTQNMVRGKYLS